MYEVCNSYLHLFPEGTEQDSYHSLSFPLNTFPLGHLNVCTATSVSEKQKTQRLSSIGKEICEEEEGRHGKETER